MNTIKFDTDQFYPPTPGEKPPIMTPVDVIGDELQFGGDGHNLRLSLHDGLGGMYRRTTLGQAMKVAGASLGMALGESHESPASNSIAGAFYSGAALAIRAETINTDPELVRVLFTVRDEDSVTDNKNATAEQLLSSKGNAMLDAFHNQSDPRSEQTLETVQMLAIAGERYVSDYAVREVAKEQACMLQFGYRYSSNLINEAKQSFGPQGGYVIKTSHRPVAECKSEDPT